MRKFLPLALLVATSAFGQSSTGGSHSVTSGTSGTVDGGISSRFWAPGPMIPYKPLAKPNVTPLVTAGYTALTATSTANLQTQINTAAAGCDNGGGSGATGYVISIAQGSVFSGANISLPITTCTTDFIVIQTTGLTWTRGTRIDPSTAVGVAAKITGTGTNLISCGAAVACHHYWFLGLDIETTGSVSGQIFLAGNVSVLLTDMPHDLVFDHVYLHGRASNSVKEGILYEANNVAIVDSWISDIHDPSNDNQAINPVVGGPSLWQNNFLEAAGENILTSASGTTLSNSFGTTFHDLEDVNNWFFKPLQWRGNNIGPVFEGIKWDIKNSHEFKGCVRCWVHFFVIQNHWGENQPGAPLLVNMQGGFAAGVPLAAYNNEERDITIEYGTVRGGSQSVQMQAIDLNFPAQVVSRGTREMWRHIAVDDNGDITMCSNPTLICPLAPNMIFTVQGGVYGLILDHLTLPQAQGSNFINGVMFFAASSTLEKPQGMAYFSNNILSHGFYGWRVNGGSSDLITGGVPVDMNKWWGGGQLPTLVNNVVEGTYPTSTGVTLNCAAWYTSTQCIGSMTSAGFTNWNSGNGGNYTLTPGSTYSATGAHPCSANPDGTGPATDCGADIATIAANIPASQTAVPTLWPDFMTGGGISLSPTSLTCNNSNTVTITPVPGSSGGSQFVQTGLDVLFHGAVITPGASSTSSITITPPTYSGAVASITNTSLTGNLAVYTAVNTLHTGDLITITGTTNGSGVFNVTNASVTVATGTSFDLVIISSNVTSAADTGSATSKVPITVSNFGLPLTASVTCN